MKMKKRFLGILLSLTLVLGLIIGMSVPAYATATGYEVLEQGDVLHLGDYLKLTTAYGIRGGESLAPYLSPWTLVRGNVGEDGTCTESETGAYYLLKDKNGDYAGVNRLMDGCEGEWPVTATSDGISVTLVEKTDRAQFLTFAVHEAPSHTHSFTYSATGATITATCTADGCDLPLVDTKNVATLTIAASGGTYDGTTQYGATVTDLNGIQGEAKVQYQKKIGESYGTATETAPTDAGTYKASITLGEATASVEYSIAQADSIANAPTDLTATYGQTLANVSLEGKNPEGNTPGTWAWADSTQSVGNVVSPAATFKANFTPTSSNYKTVENVDVTVTVSKADPTAPTGLIATYGQTLADVTLPNGWTWADSTQSVGNVIDPAATFKANFAGDDNYNAASNVEVTVTVGKANAVAATVTANNRTYDGTEKPLVTVDNSTLVGGEMQYALGTATEATGSYTTSIPTGTDAGTYYVWYKAVGDNSHSDSTPSCVTVTIKAAEKEEEPTPTPEGVTKTPTAKKGLVANGGAQELITAGEASEGKMEYALGDDESKAPAEEKFGTSIPQGTEAKTYYVWYRVVKEVEEIVEVEEESKESTESESDTKSLKLNINNNVNGNDYYDNDGNADNGTGNDNGVGGSNTGNGTGNDNGVGGSNTDNGTGNDNGVGGSNTGNGTGNDNESSGGNTDNGTGNDNVSNGGNTGNESGNDTTGNDTNGNIADNVNIRSKTKLRSITNNANSEGNNASESATETGSKETTDTDNLKTKPTTTKTIKKVIVDPVCITVTIAPKEEAKQAETTSSGSGSSSSSSSSSGSSSPAAQPQVGAVSGRGGAVTTETLKAQNANKAIQAESAAAKFGFTDINTAIEALEDENAKLRLIEAALKETENGAANPNGSVSLQVVNKEAAAIQGTLAMTKAQALAAILTPQELVDVITGNDAIDVSLEIKPNTNVNPASINAIATKLMNGEQAYYFDMDLYLSKSGANRMPVTEFNSPLRLTMSIPSAIRRPNGTYRLILSHQNLATGAMESDVYNDLDANPDTFTMDTSKLCTIAFAYVNVENAKPEAPSGAAPRTGEGAVPVELLLLALVICGMVAAIRKKSK